MVSQRTDGFPVLGTPLDDRTDRLNGWLILERLNYIVEFVQSGYLLRLLGVKSGAWLRLFFRTTTKSFVRSFASCSTIFGSFRFGWYPLSINFFARGFVERMFVRATTLLGFRVFFRLSRRGVWSRRLCAFRDAVLYITGVPCLTR